MAHVMGITLPAGWDIIYNKTLRMYDISVMCNVGKNRTWWPKKKKLALKDITYLYQIAYAWANLTDDEKAEWNYASNVIGQHNFNLYVQDRSYRMKNEIGGVASPSIYHQYLVGHLNIQEPASSCKIAQYNSRRVYFPASFEICSHTNLTAVGPNPYCRYRFVWYSYSVGRTNENIEVIEIPLVKGWDKQKKYIQNTGGRAGKWRVEVELNDVTGDMWFDNPWVLYNGEIKINDPYCLDVVKWWKGESLPDGAILETVYPIGGAL